MGTPQCRPWRSISYQATPAGPARPAGGKTLNKPHPKAGTVMENQPARHHQHDTEAVMGGWYVSACCCDFSHHANLVVPRHPFNWLGGTLGSFVSYVNRITADID